MCQHYKKCLVPKTMQKHVEQLACFKSALWEKLCGATDHQQLQWEVKCKYGMHLYHLFGTLKKDSGKLLVHLFSISDSKINFIVLAGSLLRNL